MSKSKKGSPKLGTIPKAFKRLQNRSQKMQLKENERNLLANPECMSEMNVYKSHAWHWF